jgi:hypothetical protein
VLGPWENDRGPQYLAYDAWWHLNQNTLITSEWGTPSMIEDGINPEPLVTDINLAVNDQQLYVSCWGTGELKQYDVSDPANPRETGSVRLGGIAARTAHPSEPERPLAGGPQMVEVSLDGRRVYLTNSLYVAWDDQFHPDGVGVWMPRSTPTRRRYDDRSKLLPAQRGLPRPARPPGTPPRRRRLLRFLLSSLDRLSGSPASCAD